jgi:hypothetical protein
MKSINKGMPEIVSAANSDISKKLAGGMRQFLSDESTPALGTGTNGKSKNGKDRSQGGLLRLIRRSRTAPVPELERA